VEAGAGWLTKGQLAGAGAALADVVPGGAAELPASLFGGVLLLSNHQSDSILPKQQYMHVLEMMGMLDEAAL
jgi:hypothetical protein